MVGRVVSHYRIVSELGAGGMGVVYKAEDTRLGREVALKFLSGHLVFDRGALGRFQREARAASALNHPYICTIHDVDEWDGQPFIAMELLEGEPLRARLGHARLPVATMVDLGIQLADALEAAHAKGIVHRDVKPENVFVTTRGTAKLLDFGIAKLVTEQAAAAAMVTETRVGTGPAALGTVAYMSPEQVRGESLDARTDLFSLGVVLYEMATGTQPFKGTTSGAVVGEILTKAPTAPIRLNPDVPQDLERIVNKLLEKDRELRYQSAKEVRVDLERVRRELATPARAHATGRASPNVAPSIAVLPFVNMSGDVEQEYFSDGLAEEVISVLSRIPGLKVIARTSAFAFKGKQQDVRTIAEALGVTSILEGSVRRAGNRVRVTVQLVTGADGSHLWSDRYDRQLTDIFAIQDDIAAAIAGALKVTLSPKAARRGRHEPDPEAYESYLKAIYHLWKLSREAVARSRECLERTISLDPTFALGHFGLAQHAWILASMGYLPARQAMPLVREHTQAALDIDGDLAEAHAMLGIVAGSYDYDWQEAERRFRVALSYDPVPPNVRSWHAFFYLLPMGRADEAVEQARRGLAGDPLNYAPRSMLGSCLVGARRLEEAQFEASKILEFEETQAYACSILAASHAFQGRWSEALGFAERAFPRFWLIEGMHAGILRRTGQEERAEQLINTFMPGVEYGAPLALAWCYGLSGEPDLCADWIQKALDQRPPEAPHHAFILLQSHARWRGLAALMRITQPDSRGGAAPRPAGFAIGTSGADAVEQATAGPTRPADARASACPAGVSVEGHAAYLKGRHCLQLWTEESLQKAIGHFEQAIRCDPGWPLPHAGLAEAYVWQLSGLAVRKSQDTAVRARTSAHCALELDPLLADAHVSLALVATYHDWDCEAAERHFRKALDANPDHAEARVWYALYLTCLQGRFDEALRELDRAERLDPLSRQWHGRWLVHYFRREFDAAIAEARSALDIDPNLALAHYDIGLALTAQGHFEDAIARLEQAIRLGGRSVNNVGELAAAHARAGHRDQADALLSELLQTSREGYVASVWIAAVHAALGDADAAFEWLDRGARERAGELIYILSPELHQLRRDPRFAALLRRMGLQHLTGAPSSGDVCACRPSEL